MLALTACDGVLPTQEISGGSKAISEVSMARGAVHLVAPGWCCIDQRSKRARFALIGRCDTLGAVGTYSFRSLAMIAVSVVPVEAGTSNPNADALQQSANAGEVIATQDRANISLVQMGGGDPGLEGLSDTHWRTAFVVNDQLVNLVLYAPSDSAALGPDGADLLDAIARATTAASQQGPT